MRYVMREKLFAFGNDFTIKDESGRDCYFVDGKILTIKEKLSLQDMQGNELASIREKLFSWGKTFEIYKGNRRVATVKKKIFTLFRDVFDLEDTAAGELDATGDFFDHEYTFTRDGRTIATVSKRFFSWTDTYGIDIADGEDEILILAAAVVIDMCSHEEKN
jgi:uncharacterized protein YxjI